MSPTLPGSRREVMRLAWPIGVSMVSFTLKGFIDMAMVGQLGTDALGAVGIASVTAWVAMTFPWGVLRGQRPLVSQYLGAQQRDKAFSFGVHAFYLAAAAGVLLMVFHRQLGSGFEAFAGSTELTAGAVSKARTYFETRMVWALPMLLTFAVAEYLRSVGNTRMPMVADLVVHPLNILFNWALIFGHLGLPELGVYGAALGTGLADTAGMLLLFYLARPRTGIVPGTLRLRWARMRKVVTVGLSGGVQFTLESASFLGVTWIVGHAGKQALAVHQAGIQLIQLSLLPAVAVADAGSVLIGRFVGELRWDDVRRTLRSTLEILLPFMTAMGLVFLLRGRALASIFLNDEDPERLRVALELAGGVTAAAALWQLADALQVAFRFALRATGDHRWVMWTGILCSWVISLPLAWWVVFVLEGTVAQVWLVWGSELFVGSAIFVWRWRSGAWMRKRLVEDEQDA